MRRIELQNRINGIKIDIEKKKKEMEPVLAQVEELEKKLNVDLKVMEIMDIYGLSANDDIIELSFEKKGN